MRTAQQSLDDSKGMVRSMTGKLAEEEAKWLSSVTVEDMVAITANFLAKKLMTEGVAERNDDLGYHQAIYDETH